VLSEKQLEKFYEKAKSFELQLMIMVMVQTGMRVGELVNFKINWIDFESKAIRIQSNKGPVQWSPKRESERSIPISSNLLDTLQRHLKNRKKGYVFQSQKKRVSKKEGDKTITARTHQKYNYRSIIRKINKISNEIMGKDTGSHIFRATYASHLLKKGLTLEGIRKLMGHTDIKTTLIYIRSIPDFNEWEKVRDMELMKVGMNLLKS